MFVFYISLFAMSVIQESTYLAPFYMLNGKMETILPRVFRRVAGLSYQRERMDTSDEDFLDLDWIRSGYDQLVILSHGLEGSSERTYVKGMAKLFNRQGWDILAWNCRSCSGEMNRQLKLYHHGDTGDLEEVIAYVLSKYAYRKVVLIGFSMGGSLVLKYLGEQSNRVPKEIKAAVAISVPCNLGASARAFSTKGNGFFRRRFLRKLKKKMLIKAAQFPGKVNIQGIDEIEHFIDFDNQFTAPINGFKDADDFYRHSSCENHLDGIKTNALLLNARNDPMLPEACFPADIAAEHPYLWLEMPLRGGHVGFTSTSGSFAWSEIRALEFIAEHLDEN